MNKGDNKVSKVEEYNTVVSNMQNKIRRLSESLEVGNKAIIDHIQKRYTTEEAAEFALEQMDMAFTMSMLLDGEIQYKKGEK